MVNSASESSPWHCDKAKQLPFQVIELMWTHLSPSLAERFCDERAIQRDCCRLRLNLLTMYRANRFFFLFCLTFDSFCTITLFWEFDRNRSGSYCKVEKIKRKWEEHVSLYCNIWTRITWCVAIQRIANPTVPSLGHAYFASHPCRVHFCAKSSFLTNLNVLLFVSSNHCLLAGAAKEGLFSTKLSLRSVGLFIDLATTVMV